MSRDTELVKTEPEVRKARKHLLSELGVLVSLSRKANSMSNVELTEETELEIEALGEAIQSRTERLVHRANRLLEIATPLTELWKEEDIYIPPTPPISGGGFEFATEGGGWEFSQGARKESMATTGGESLVSLPSSLSDDGSNPSVGIQATNWALNRLDGTHDTLLSYLAAYIGRLHLQSRSPGQIFETTNQCVIAARNFLGVVRAITTRKGNRLSATGTLEQSSNHLWIKCTTLVNVAREVVSSHGVGETEEEDVVIDAEVKKLVEAATACVRSAGECVALGHCLLEAMGDFELPAAALNGGRESLMSLGSPDEYQFAGSRRSSTSKHLSKQLPPPPSALSEDNPRRPLPVPPSYESSTRKTPPKLKLVQSHAYTTARSQVGPSSSARSASHPISPLHHSSDVAPSELKHRDVEPQSKFLAVLRESDSQESLNSKSRQVQYVSLSITKPEIVEPPTESPFATKVTRVRQVSHPQLQRDSLFRSESDEALRLADTLTMPRAGSSTSSSVDVDVDPKSIPTTPEPGTPVRATHATESREIFKTVILNADGQVYPSIRHVAEFRLWVRHLKVSLNE